MDRRYRGKAAVVAIAIACLLSIAFVWFVVELVRSAGSPYE